ncbi:MAG: hypothetical protein ACE5F9_05385 [Phycisphaerae bacterium]
MAMISALVGAGCSSNALQGLFGGTPVPNPVPAVAVAVPAADTPVAPGAAAIIRWADIAPDAGTVISVRAQRRNATNEADGPELVLLDGRDAVADGDGDIFEWDITGVRVGNYDIRVIITAPDGTTAEDTSDGRFMVTTALPVPTLAITAPGATDETFNAGDMFVITWTDNGTTNTDAKVVLGLDLDFDHTEGDEIILLRDQPLSTDDDTGAFTFSGVDENSTTVPPESYVVFAIIDDGANDPVEAEAVGRLIIAP